MKTPMWRHQVEAFEWARQRRGSMLAMWMGTGKSLVGAAHASAPTVQKTLIVAPARVVQVWPGQFAQHCVTPPMVVPLTDDLGTIADRARFAQDKLQLAAARGQQVAFVINYEAVWRPGFAKWFEAQARTKGLWDLLILDECHRLKSPRSEISKWFTNAGKLFKKRIGLTGTPMPQTPLDVFAQYRVLDPTIFGYLYTPFKQRYGIFNPRIPEQVVGYQNMDELTEKFHSIAYRAGKDTIQLPPETFSHVYCELGTEARRVYKSLEKDLIAQTKDGTVTVSNALVKLLRLQQITGGSVAVDAEEYGDKAVIREIDTAKANLLAEVLEDAGGDEPVVVFCRYISDLERVHQAAAAAGRVSLELSGRRDELAAWQRRADGSVLAVQIQAGGVGVDLTRARYSVFYSLSFSLAEYQQALARTHRPGQTKPVTHIHLVARGTVDENIHRALEDRAEVIRFVLDELTKERKNNAHRAA